MGPEALQAIEDFIRNLGFPIAVAIWLLWQVRPRLDKLAQGQKRIVQVLRILAVMKCAAGGGEDAEKIRRLLDKGSGEE